MTTLAKQRNIVEESNIIYYSPSERVPEQFFCSNSGYFYNNNEVKKNWSVNQALIDKTFATDDSHTSHNKLIDCNRK